ncbi:hypothetical protein, partial [Bifidobacterium bifidum]|uniref:hypothetical protein n=1 Tax=Bifidobacterium bifidum TaxID=1681 RepID=UPI0021C404FD
MTNPTPPKDSSKSASVRMCHRCRYSPHGPARHVEPGVQSVLVGRLRDLARRVGHGRRAGEPGEDAGQVRADDSVAGSVRVQAVGQERAGRLHLGRDGRRAP